MFLGTIVNAAAILAGGLAGLLLHRGLRQEITDTVMKGLGLVVVYIGISGALEGKNVLIAVISIAAGGILGGALDLDGRFTRFADGMQAKLAKGKDSEKNTLGEGFVTATLLFCVGAMAIVGSLNSGLRGDHQVLFTKSLLDGISAAMFASALGPGVLLSAVPVLLYQGAVTLLASILAPVLTDPAVAEMTCVGSLLILALGLNMIGYCRIRVMNYIFGMFLPVLLTRFL